MRTISPPGQLRRLNVCGALILLTTSLTAPAALRAGAPIYLKVHENGLVEYTDNPTRYSDYEVFIKGKSRSGSRFVDYAQNFHLYDEQIRALGKENGVSPALIKAIVMAESAFNPSAESPSGAQGLMQVIPSTQRLVGITDPWDPADNLAGGTRYLKQMLVRFKGSVRLAAAAYNAGPEAVRRNNGVPPYAETQFYVKRVENLYDQFRKNDLELDRR